MRHGSLFSGIGGFDLAAEWMGWTNAFHCEWNEFGQKVLKHYWPKAISYADITKIDFRPHRGSIDIISGGFPCQPFSNAGKRKGTDDARHLWPEMCRAIREIKPTYVVGENVRGLLNWSGGLVFDQVCVDLEALGYDVQPFLLPACAVNAPHRRDRIWFVARRDTPDSDSLRQSRQGRPKGQINTTSPGDWQKYRAVDDGRWPTQSPVRTRNDGLPAGLDIDTISESKWCKESIKAAGNAIVPQVAYQIFKTIQSHENTPHLPTNRTPDV